MRCLIVEDEVILAQLLAHSLSTVPGMRSVATSHSVATGISSARRLVPDLLIIDLKLPDGSGVDVAEDLLTHNPAGRVIVLSAQADAVSCSRRLHHAITAVIEKTEVLDKLHDEVRALMGHDPAAAATGEPSLAELTAREHEVLVLIGQGLSTEGIARRLCISPTTAQTHRKHITAKLGIKGSELVLYASRIAAPDLSVLT
jgi:DNA-binding NarL/FixJ family response regulator